MNIEFSKDDLEFQQKVRKNLKIENGLQEKEILLMEKHY